MMEGLKDFISEKELLEDQKMGKELANEIKSLIDKIQKEKITNPEVLKAMKDALTLLKKV